MPGCSGGSGFSADQKIQSSGPLEPRSRLLRGCWHEPFLVQAVGMHSDLQAWFVSDILPHQPALTRYLRRMCRSAHEVPDLRQETYFRLYESASKARSRPPKA